MNNFDCNCRMIYCNEGLVSFKIVSFNSKCFDSPINTESSFSFDHPFTLSNTKGYQPLQILYSGSVKYEFSNLVQTNVQLTVPFKLLGSRNLREVLFCTNCANSRIIPLGKVDIGKWVMTKILSGEVFESDTAYYLSFCLHSINDRKTCHLFINLTTLDINSDDDIFCETIPEYEIATITSCLSNSFDKPQNGVKRYSYWPAALNNKEQGINGLFATGFLHPSLQPLLVYHPYHDCHVLKNRVSHLEGFNTKQMESFL